MTPEERLDELGLRLPPAWEPGASLEMCVPHDDLLHVAGHLGIDMSRVVEFHGRDDHHPLVPGRIGEDVDVEQALAAARGGALNVIATLKRVLGELTRVRRIIKTTAFVSSVDGFADAHLVADAASDLLIQVFGDAGRHARSTVGVTTLPGGACFALEALIAIDLKQEALSA